VHGGARGAHDESRLRVPDQRVVEIDALRAAVIDGRAEAGRDGASIAAWRRRSLSIATDRAAIGE